MHIYVACEVLSVIITHFYVETGRWVAVFMHFYDGVFDGDGVLVETGSWVHPRNYSKLLFLTFGFKMIKISNIVVVGRLFQSGCFF